MGVLQHAQTTCYLHYFASLTKQGWFQGHRFRALGPRLKCAAPCLSEERLQILGQEKTAGCFSSQCVPTQQNPSSSHQQSTRNTSRSLKNKVEPVWSYGGFEWLLFPAFPSHDIQMISWSVPGFSPHSCTIHQDISSITTGPRTAQLTLESLSKSRARKSGYAISWSRSSNPQYLQTFARLIWFEEGAPKLLVTVSRWSLKNWQKMARWPMKQYFHWRLYMKHNNNRSSL